MFTDDTNFTVKLSRTLWSNTFRGKVSAEGGEYIASVRIMPMFPLDKENLPEDAPEAVPYLTVLVDDGVITTKDLVSFEAKLAPLLLAKFKRDDFAPELCQYFYPSPMSLMEPPSCS